METRTYDAVVIGGGPGGYVAAIRLGQLGKRTALVEKQSLGGTCLNWGCIPSKALIAAANLVDELRGAAARGIQATPVIDARRLRQYKADVVKKLVSGIGTLQKGNGVEVVQGTARLMGPQAVEVEGPAGTLCLEAQALVLASGARPIAIPGFEPDGKDVWGPAEAVDIPEIPRRLVVIGGGVIGLELGTAYAKLGSAVTVVEALPTVLAGVDVDAVRLVQRALRQRSVAVYVSAIAKCLERRDDGLVVLVDAAGKPLAIPCDKVLVSIGFRPHTQGLGLEQAGVRVGPKGFVEVDQGMHTSVPSVFCIGDLTGPPLLAHKASRQGEIAAEVIAGRPVPKDEMVMPAAIFTEPEVAVVGLGEEEARNRGLDPVVGKFSFAALGRAVAMGRGEGFAKVIADRASKRLLGAVIAGPEAAELIGEAALAVQLGARLEDLANTVHAHPTLPEALMEASKVALGCAIHAINKPERPRT